MMHHNESIFPDSYKFKPERWLEPRPEGSPPLERYMVSFSKGSRQCVGMKSVSIFLYLHPPMIPNSTKKYFLCSLARAELNLTLATVFRRFDNQQLFESSRLDVDVKHDFLLPQQDKKSKGVKVLFK